MPPTPRRDPRALLVTPVRVPARVLGLALGLALATRPAAAQVFQLQGGGSSLFEGYGGVLSVWGNGYEGSLGIGYLDGIRLGWSARRLLAGRDTLRLGNDALPFHLETDVFGGGSVGLRGHPSGSRAFRAAPLRRKSPRVGPAG